MVPSQAERRNAKQSLARPCECPKCANRVHAFGTPKFREFVRRPTEPHFCVPPGDAAIAACKARVCDALELTQVRDNSLC